MKGSLVLLLITTTCQTLAKLPLQDAKAVANQLFTYKIDPSDFPNQDIKVIETGKAGLPSWLHYDEAKHELVGVPSLKDKGTTSILSVGEEIFAVKVVEPTKTHVAEPVKSGEPTTCKLHDSITVVYVKLNADVDKLKALERSRLVRSISDHLYLKPAHISLSPKPRDLLDSNMALVAGPGEAAPGDVLSTFSWAVGCGAVKSQHMDILERLESSTKDGTIGKLLGIPVSGWQVQSNKPLIVKSRRLKRNVLATTTPTPLSGSDTSTVTSPSSTVQPTAGPDISSQSTSPSPTSSSPTSSPPTAVETRPPPVKRKPIAHKNLLPASITARAGELLRWRLPEGLFTDPDGQTLSYDLRDVITKNKLYRLEPWLVQEIQGSGGSYEIVGIPKSDTQGRTKTVLLRATNSYEKSEDVEIRIDILAKEFGLLTEVYKFSARSTDSLTSGAGDLYLALTLTDHLNLTSYTLLKSGKSGDRINVEFGDNRGKQDDCPTAINSNIGQRLRKLVDQPISLQGREARDSLMLTSVNKIEPKDPCKDHPPQISEGSAANYKKVTILKGELFESTLPLDLFTDKEDGDLSMLKIMLISDGSKECKTWMCYDAKNRILQALKWNDKPINTQFELVAQDSIGQTTNLYIEVELGTTYRPPSTHLITATFINGYSQFANSLSDQAELYRKLNKAFPNYDVLFLSIKEGSLVLQFRLMPSNSSYKEDQCPVSITNEIKKTITDGKSLNSSFVKTLQPFTIKKIEFAPEGACVEDIQPWLIENELAIGPDTDKTTKGDTSYNTIIIVVVAVVTVIVLIVIVILICIRRKKNKHNEPKASVHIEKGVPRVLDEEMRAIERSEQQPLMKQNQDLSYKPATEPPAYPKDEKRDGYQPPTPPVSEPDENREHDKSL